MDTGELHVPELIAKRGTPLLVASKMKITDDREASEMEQLTRFAFGGVLGLIVGAILFSAAVRSSVVLAILLFLLSVPAFGLLALLYGDRFWYKLGDFLGFW